MPIDQAKLAKLQALSAGNRTGGKGTPRRKVQSKKVAGGEDKKLQSALKKLNVQPVSGIEEINMFKEDGNVLHFKQPKIQGVGSANTYALYGPGADKELTELVPGILSQLGPDSLASLRKLAESYQAMNAAQMAGGGAGAAGAGLTGGEGEDDEVPDVPTNFDEAADGAEAGADSKAAEAEIEKLD